MLAEVLERSRDRVVDELERRAAVMESTELSGVGRRNRLGAFVDELIEALCRGRHPGADRSRSRDPSTNRCSNFANASWCGATSSSKIEQQEVAASPQRDRRRCRMGRPRGSQTPPRAESAAVRAARHHTRERGGVRTGRARPVLQPAGCAEHARARRGYARARSSARRRPSSASPASWWSAGRSTRWCRWRARTSRSR